MDDMYWKGKPLKDLTREELIDAIAVLARQNQQYLNELLDRRFTRRGMGRS